MTMSAGRCAPPTIAAWFLAAAVASAQLPEDMQARAEAAVARLNALRAESRLPAVELDAELSQACMAHAAFVDLHGADYAHAEDATLAGYSVAGDEAARNSDVAFDDRAAAAIDAWYRSYYHRNPMVNPNVVRVGYGDNAGETFGFAITVVWFDDYGPPGNVLTPGDGAVDVYPAANDVGEDPAPFEGFDGDNGNPIIAYFAGATGPDDTTVTYVSSSVSADGAEIEHRVISPDRPSNPAFEINEIALLPEHVLPRGKRIDVRLTCRREGVTEDVVLRWSFTTRSDGPPGSTDADADGSATTGCMGQGAGLGPAWVAMLLALRSGRRRWTGG